MAATFDDLYYLERAPEIEHELSQNSHERKGVVAHIRSHSPKSGVPGNGWPFGRFDAWDTRLLPASKSGHVFRFQ